MLTVIKNFLTQLNIVYTNGFEKILFGITSIAIFLIIILSIRVNILFFQSEDSIKADEIYLEVGHKHIPLAALNSFNKYGIDLKLTQEEEETITPLEDFFIMGFDIPEDVEKYASSPNEYELSIVGEVENPVSLKYEELLEKFKREQMVTELYCTPSLTGVGKFVGPSLYDITSYAKPKDEVAKVVFIAGDGYEKGWREEFPLKMIEEKRETYILAMAMNGYPLSIEHG